MSHIFSRRLISSPEAPMIEKICCDTAETGDNRNLLSRNAAVQCDEPLCGACSKSRWYVVQTHRQAELWALQNLVRRGWDAYLPMVQEYRRDPVLKTMTRIVDVPCWPGYLLVQFDRATSEWRPITKTEGVKAIMGSSPVRPTPIPTAYVEKLMASADERRIVRVAPEPIAVGTPLQVVDGPFADQAGVCLWAGEERVRMMMQVLGAVVAVDMARKAVRVVEGV